MAEHPTHRGRIRPAPENFLSEADIAAVKEGRRDFLRKALATASAAAAAPGLARAAEGDPNILTLPPWTTSLGQAVAARPYGLPSQYEKGLQLYSSGVLIMDKCPDLLPEHFRFVRGVVDSPDLSQFLSQNQEQFENKSVAELLNRLFEKKHISKAALAKQAGMSEIYLHQIFAGRRNPSRNRLLCLCYGLEATVDETQELLKLCGMAQLYPKLKRDAIIYYGLLHRLKLFEINDKLFEENEETLF